MSEKEIMREAMKQELDSSTIFLDKQKAYRERSKAFRQGTGVSKYIPMPTEIPFGAIGVNNRKRKNERGANPRRFTVQKVKEQIKVGDEVAGEILVPTGKVKTLIHSRTL
jgi:hypothetical protein